MISNIVFSGNILLSISTFLMQQLGLTHLLVMYQVMSKYVSFFYQHVILEKQNHQRLFSIAIYEME